MSRPGQEPKTPVALSDGPVRNPDVVVIRKEHENRHYWERLLMHTLSRKNLMALTGLASSSKFGARKARVSKAN